MNTQNERITDSHRRSFIGGSDARIIIGADEAALHRLRRKKRGEAEPEDLSGNLIVQLGLVTEGLNRLSASLVWRPCLRGPCLRGPCRGSATWRW